MTLALLKGQLATAGLGPNKVLVNGKLSKTLVRVFCVCTTVRLRCCRHCRAFVRALSCPMTAGRSQCPVEQAGVLARGIAAAILRRYLAALVEAGLIERRDSPNGQALCASGQGRGDRGGIRL